MMRGRLSAGAAAVLLAANASAQSPRAWRVRVLTDTNSAQVQVLGQAAAAADVSIIDPRDGAVVWRGRAAGEAVAGTGPLGVRRWSPEQPERYRVEVQAEGRMVASVMTGFRSVRTDGTRILLNGRPMFLRGNAINPPGRNIPDSLDASPAFARSYLRRLKAAGVNIVRLGEPSTVWFEAADEVGMAVFQGHYGVPRGGTSSRPPRDVEAAVRWYRDSVLALQENHPSILIYALSNEVASPEVPYLADVTGEMSRFIDSVYRRLRAVDPSRLYIGNAGYGYGRGGELCDLHRYWGWYYNSFLSFYLLREPRACRRGDVPQPMMMSEIVGNYTGRDGRVNLVSNTKQPDAQLNWTGHAPDAEQGRRAEAYQAWLAGQAIEIPRRLRPRVPWMAGVVPFTILWSNWDDIRSVDDMGAKPIVAQYARSFAPVLLSWENWTTATYAGRTLAVRAHVINDALDGRSLAASALRWTLHGADGRAVASGRVAMPAVPYYEARSTALSVAVPATAAAGIYELRGALVRGADTVARNATTVRVWPAPSKAAALARRLVLYDDAAKRSTRALAQLGVAVRDFADADALDPRRDALIVGAHAWDVRMQGQPLALRRFVAAGGRVLVLEQSPGRGDVEWLPGGLRRSATALDHLLIMPGNRPFKDGMAVNIERAQHPVFTGLSRDDLFLWNDYSSWHDGRPALPAVYPVTAGLAIRNPEAMGDIAVLANYDRGLEGIALAEAFIGGGSVLASGFDLIARVGMDPAADRLLSNLVQYVADGAAHDAAPLVRGSIRWGDYASEAGLLTGIYSGLLLNTEPVVPSALAAKYPLRRDSLGFAYAGAAGGWNTKPAVQYVARGRRPFGPYSFGDGGSTDVTDGHGPLGIGRVWMRLPSDVRLSVTTIENPTDVPLKVAIALDGDERQALVPGRSSVRLEHAVRAMTGNHRFVVTGDRRLILLTTEFR